jgi:hypothetical protein
MVALQFLRDRKVFNGVVVILAIILIPISGLLAQEDKKFQLKAASDGLKISFSFWSSS